MHLWSIAWKNLWRRQARSMLTVLGIAVAVTAMVALVGVAESLESSYLKIYTHAGADLVVQRRGGAVQLAKGVAVTFSDRVRQIPGVQEVIGSLVDMISFEDRDLFMVLVNGWKPDCPTFDRVHVLSGRRLRAGDQKSVMLGRILAANLGKQEGDTVQIYGQPFQVVGVFESFSVYENGAVFMLLGELQRQMDRPGEMTGFIVNCTDKRPQAIAQIRRQIESLDANVVAVPSAEFVSSLTQIKITRSMSWFTSMFAIVIGAIGVLNTMAMSVFERRGEIASLRAMGWRKRRVAQLIVGEALCLSVLGAALGIAMGIGATRLLTVWRATSGLVQGDISLRAIAEGIGVAIVIALIGAALPANRCASQPIAEALHDR